MVGQKPVLLSACLHRLSWDGNLDVVGRLQLRSCVSISHGDLKPPRTAPVSEQISVGHACVCWDNPIQPSAVRLNLDVLIIVSHTGVSDKIVPRKRGYQIAECVRVKDRAAE